MAGVWFGDPFAGRAAGPIVHCSHHKAGTVWFEVVLRRLAAALGLSFFSGPQSGYAGQDIFLQPHSRIDPAALPGLRGTHMVRDPLDMIVSGYFYHLKCQEAWALKPRQDLAGQSFQAHLQGLDRSAGLRAEVDRFAAIDMPGMRDWPVDMPGMMNLRYEDLIRDEIGGFARIFAHYGLADAAIEVGLEIVRGASRSGPDAARSHIRSGEPGDWQNHLDGADLEYALAACGQTRAALGYGGLSTEVNRRNC